MTRNNRTRNAAEEHNRAMDEKLKGVTVMVTPSPTMASKRQARKKRTPVIPGTRGTFRINQGLRDAPQRIQSRTVHAVAYNEGTTKWCLAKGVATTTLDTLEGFVNWDAHLTSIASAFRFFRVTSLVIEATMAAGPNTGANIAVGYQMGPIAPEFIGNLMDNEHVMFVPAAVGVGKLVVPRRGLLKENEWYACSNQILSQSQFTKGGSTVDVNVVLPSTDDALQGRIVYWPSAGTVTSGNIAWLTVTSTVEFKEPL